MEIKLKALADYANLSKEGKLNIMGIFDQINPPRLPFLLPNMYVVLAFDASPVESGTQRDIKIILLDEDANEVVSIGQQMIVPTPSRPGARIQMNQIVSLAGVKFSGAGDYQFSILVDNDEKGVIPFRVNDIPKPQVEVEND